MPPNHSLPVLPVSSRAFSISEKSAIYGLVMIVQQVIDGHPG